MNVDLTEYIRKAQGITLHANSDLKDIFLKDAIYKAAGLSAFNLFDDVRKSFAIFMHNKIFNIFGYLFVSIQIDFDEWFTKQLVHEATIKGENFRIIRRRVIWLIGQWTSVKFDRNLRPKVYELCLLLLQPDEDMCVRLAACK